MSILILMRILESTPSFYDKGIRIITFGKLNRSYGQLVSYIKKKDSVLDIGCGTGALSLMAAAKGALVKGIDIEPRMLEIAENRAKILDLRENTEFCEMGTAELGEEASGSYDAVASALCFSELTEDEMSYALKEVERILKPGGLLLIADEVLPGNVLKRMLNRLIRFPLIIITYLISRKVTAAVRSLPRKVEGAGLKVQSTRMDWMESFAVLVAIKPKK